MKFSANNIPVDYIWWNHSLGNLLLNGTGVNYINYDH